MNDEKTINIDGTKLKESDLTPEQNVAKIHIQSLKSKISKLEFEINELLPSLRFYENKLIQSVKESADENLKTEKKVVGEL